MNANFVAAKGNLAAFVRCIDLMPLPTVIVEPGIGRFVHANKSFKTKFVSPGINNLAALVDTADRPGLLPHMAGGEQGDPDSAPLIRITLPEGETAWVKIFVQTFRLDLAPAASLLMVQLVDFTPSKTMLDDLVARETRWNSALISSESGVWDHDYRAGRKYYSPTWRRIRGMTLDDPLPASKEAWLQRVHPDDREFILRAMERQEAGDPQFQFYCYRELHKDGHYVWIECRGACIDRDESGRAMRVVGTDNDVTARKDMEQRAAKVSRRLEMALAISGIGVFEADLTTGELEWDDPMYDIFQMPRDEKLRLGHTWEDCVHPDDIARVQANIEKHAELGLRYVDQYRIVLRNGTVRHIRACGMHFTDVDGHDKIVGANWDVTEEVRIRDELERSNRFAEARNAELEATKIQIEHNALHDYLTNLPNRRYFDRKLNSLAEQCRTENLPLGILHIDLDGFKQINDSLGHKAGDEVLRQTAKILANIVGAEHFVARVGGDEFMILAQFKGGQPDLAQLAEAILDSFETPLILENSTCHFGASIGIAWASGNAVNAEQLLANADIALYRAKGSGKNRHMFFS